jgi:hypothetical protein
MPEFKRDFNLSRLSPESQQGFKAANETLALIKQLTPALGEIRDPAMAVHVQDAFRLAREILDGLTEELTPDPKDVASLSEHTAYIKRFFWD